MGRIAIVTDSTTSIPEAYLEQYHIHTVPYYIHRGKDTLRDLVTVTREAFYAWLPSATELPQTASPGPGDYYEMYGWITLEAARAALEGVSFDSILEGVQRLIPNVHMIQTADTLRYLYMGGRIGRAKHLVGSLLNIKPLISMENGTIVALGTARNRSKAYQRMAEIVEGAVGKMGKIKIAYTHAAASEEILKLKEIVETRVSIAESLISELSPALGVHTGPGTVGFCYYPVE